MRIAVSSAALAALLLVAAPAARAADPSRRQVFDMAMSERFDELEASLGALQARFEKNADTKAEDWLSYLLATFHSSNAGLDARLRKWKETKPGSCFARAAEGARLMGLAGEARGGRWASETTAEQKRSMAALAAEGVKELRAAVTCNASLTSAWAELMTAGSLTSDSDLQDSALTHGLLAQPVSLVIRRSHLFDLAPKWGGTLDEIDRFLALSKDKVSAETYTDLADSAVQIRAEFLLDHKRADEALALLNGAVAKSPSWRLFYQRGVVLLDRGRNEEALADLNRALELRADSGLILDQRSRALTLLGRPDEALADVNAALVYDERDPRLLGIRGNLLQKAGRHDEAAGDAQKALALGSQRSEAWLKQGQGLLNSKKDAEGARVAFLNAIALDPDEPNAWFGYGAALYEQRSSAALDAFDHFAYLCGSGKKCEAADLQWLNEAIRSGAIWFFWPRIALRWHLVNLLW